MICFASFVNFSHHVLAVSRVNLLSQHNLVNSLDLIWFVQAVVCDAIFERESERFRIFAISLDGQNLRYHPRFFPPEIAVCRIRSRNSHSLLMDTFFNRVFEILLTFHSARLKPSTPANHSLITYDPQETGRQILYMDLSLNDLSLHESPDALGEYTNMLKYNSRYTLAITWERG